MSEYKLYFLDESGHITSAMDLDCRNDHDAIAVARSLPGKHGRELWQYARKVKEIEQTAP
jgi:hypothetical protein